MWFRTLCIRILNSILSFGRFSRVRSFLYVPLSANWKKNWSHFDLKSWVSGGTKTRSGIPSIWKIFEWNWVDIESQFYSNILQLPGNPGRILVPPVTQLFRSKWLHFFLPAYYCAIGIESVILSPMCLIHWNLIIKSNTNYI